MKNPKISIITVVKNGMPYLSDCLKSFELQDYANKEHIIIYSNSNDATEEFLLSQKKKIKILRKDNKFNNKWDCLNLGAKLATGDIIGILHADDIFYNKNTLSRVAKNFTDKYEFIYGSILFCEKNNILKIKREWISEKIDINKLKYGWMAPHPSFFVRKKILLKNKYVNNYNISGDYHFMLSLLHKKYKYKFINHFLCIMRLGGGSTKIKNFLEKISEDIKIAKSFFTSYYICVFLKIFRKIFQIKLLTKELKNNDYFISLNKKI
jgi:glycosyltransferase involved in cell wall biosynthesis